MFKKGDIVECIERGHHEHVIGRLYKVIYVTAALTRVAELETDKSVGSAYHHRFRLAKEIRILNILKQIDEL